VGSYGGVMGELLNRFKILMAILFIVGIVISFFTIYLPMRTELEKNSIEKFVLMAQLNDLIINQYIERCVDSVEALFSRHVIKSRIEEYRKGFINFQELKDSVSSQYLEELGTIKDVIGAKRVVDNQEVMSYGQIINFNNTKEYNLGNTSYNVDFQGVDLLISIYSPIKEEDEVLGYDIVYFDMNPILRSINNGDIKSFVLNIYEAEGRKKNKLDYIDIDDMHIIEDGYFIGYLYPIKGTDKFLYTRISKSILFSSADEVTRLYLIGVVIVIFVFVVLTIWLTDKNTKKILNKSQKSILKYREYAVKDSLTGVYSRFFLDGLISGNIVDYELENIMKGINYIILIDIDNFKQINDEYGHIAGDKTIKKIAEILKLSVREDDLVVRYGGDEFLILLKNTNREVAEKVLERIKNKLKEIDGFDSPITISGGIEELKDISSIEECLKSADDKMYNVKRMKKVDV